MSDIADNFLPLEVLGTIEEKCLSGNVLDLVEFIKAHFVIRSPELQNKVLYQAETPGASDRGKVWIRKSKSTGVPMGLFYYDGNIREWISVPTQVDLKERIFYKFDTSLELKDMPVGYALDDDENLVRQRVFDSQGRILYAWLRRLDSPI